MKKPSKKLVCGVGHNDADYPVAVNALIGGKRKQLWLCPFYRTWRGMLKRCYSATYQSEKPTYIDCSVAPEWLTFSVFRAWMSDQEHRGMQLDKDLLTHGNMVYGPSTCVFISAKLNKFLTDSGATRGEWPIGVYWNKQHSKFAALCSNPFSGKQEHLGYFATPTEAHETWRNRKHEHAVALAYAAIDPRVAEALSIRYA